MGHSKLSVTIPDEIYRDIKVLSSKMNIKLSRFVSEALAEKLKKIKEQEFVRKIDKIFDDPEIAEAQRLMAETIADTVEMDELPW